MDKSETKPMRTIGSRGPSTRCRVPLNRDVRMRNIMSKLCTWLTVILVNPVLGIAAEPSPDSVISTNQAICIAVNWIKQGPVWYWTNFVSATLSDAAIPNTDNITVHEFPEKWTVSFFPLQGADPDYSDAQPCNIQVIIDKDGGVSFPPKEDTLHGEVPEEGYRVKNARWLNQQNNMNANKALQSIGDKSPQPER